MSLSSIFATDFHNIWKDRSKKIPYNEIDQFRLLQEVIQTLSKKYYIEEYHGNNHQVSFPTEKKWSKKIGRCELSDLMVITYSDTPELNIRLCFIQAKRSVKQYVFCGTQPLQSSSFTFSANLEQWDLLSNKPIIIGVPPFQPPSSLLRDSILSSVGTFVVFHKTNNGEVSFFYTTADTLKPKGEPKKKKASLILKPSFSTHQDERSQYIEQTFACCPYIFSRALFEGLIGTPIHNNPYIDKCALRDLQKWLSEVYNKISKEKKFPIFENIIQGFDRNELYLRTDTESEPPSNLIVINTDKKKGYLIENNRNE